MYGKKKKASKGGGIWSGVGRKLRGSGSKAMAKGGKINGEPTWMDREKMKATSKAFRNR